MASGGVAQVTLPGGGLVFLQGAMLAPDKAASVWGLGPANARLVC